VNWYYEFHVECLCHDIKLARGVKSGWGDICILVLVEEKRLCCTKENVNAKNAYFIAR
jgi:hypothetical protein